MQQDRRREMSVYDLPGSEDGSPPRRGVTSRQALDGGARKDAALFLSNGLRVKHSV